MDSAEELDAYLRSVWGKYCRNLPGAPTNWEMLMRSTVSWYLYELASSRNIPNLNAHTPNLFERCESLSSLVTLASHQPGPFPVYDFKALSEAVFPKLEAVVRVPISSYLSRNGRAPPISYESTDRDLERRALLDALRAPIPNRSETVSEVLAILQQEEAILKQNEAAKAKEHSDKKKAEEVVEEVTRTGFGRIIDIE